MPVFSLSIPQTSVGTSRPVSADSVRSPVLEQASSLFFHESPGCPLDAHDPGMPEFDVGRDECKFVAGWPCVRMLSQSEEIAAASAASSSREVFFSVANPADSDVRRQFAGAYAQHSHEGSGVRQEIGQALLAQARDEAARLDVLLPARDVMFHQAYRVNTSTGNGASYLHKRDQAFHGVLDAPGTPIHTFLPGYATGDRYSLILAMLIEPRLHVSVAYTKGNGTEEQHAREAADVLERALRCNGIESEQRVALFEYTGGSLKDARESLDTPATRSNFVHQQGAPGPLASSGDGSHVFHISATTELIARQFRTCGDRREFSAHVRGMLDSMVSPTDRIMIDSLVDRVIEEQKIEHGAVGLWIADREFANAREAEAISRPTMFEQIADQVKREGRAVYCIADTYINRARDEHNNDRLVDRHPYRPDLPPHVGRFWAAEIDGERPLQARENQWYFMNQLLQKVGGPLVGIRSGALEPFALMGHQVIYLEHKGMFTPERHACWQNIIPYHRLITARTTGYLDKHTEVFRANTMRSLLADNLAARQSLGPMPDPAVADDTMTAPSLMQTLRGHAFNQAASRRELAAVEDDLRQGVMSGNELRLLMQMIDTGQPAWQSACALWGDSMDR